MPKIPARIRVILLLLVAAILPACAQTPAMVANPAPVAAEDYRRAFEASLASLKSHGFQIDRQDYRFGTITTKPRVAPNALEIWNADNSTTEQAVSASLNNQHRIATVKLARAAADNAAPQAAYSLAIEVAIERTTDPNRRLTGAADGRYIVRPLKATPEQFQREGVQGKSTHFVERDEPFEQKLLADIGARLASATIEPLQNGQ